MNVTILGDAGSWCILFTCVIYDPLELLQWQTRLRNHQLREETNTSEHMSSEIKDKPVVSKPEAYLKLPKNDLQGPIK